jgi:leader peptidase (prepilin peptidase) / N-methyltransferase
VNNMLALPIELRCALVFLIGLTTARFINWSIYNWAYFPRQLGPWAPPVAKQSIANKKKKRSAEQVQRSWKDHLPVWGWWRLRGEQSVHGKGYWIRPLLIELIFPIALALYYRFQTTTGGLPPGAVKLLLPMQPQMHFQFLGHWVLLSLMAIATFIDFDEQSIPDYITIPGTIIGIVGAALSPLWLPLTVAARGSGIVEMDAAWPAPIPDWFGTTQGLGVGLLILLVWGFALLDRRVIWRRGWKKAAIYFFARMFRYRALWLTVLLSMLGLMIFTVACYLAGTARWNFLLSSLLGMAFAGGLTWAVRISASYGYGIEALGFGDVTLMAMIGAFIGWQPSLIVFFLAPFVGMVFVIIRWIITRELATPYGPYLCGAVVVLLIYWEKLWLLRFMNLFVAADELAVNLIGPKLNWSISGAELIMVGSIVCVILIGMLLWILQLLKRILLRSPVGDTSK